jgi:spore germination cell wall hydrolase CwlJ-like protein
MKKFFTALVLSLSAISANAGEMDILFHEADNPEYWCLAQNIYYEARSSNLADQVAVADVVLNRVQDSRFPNTICGVVRQGKQKPSWKDPSKMVMVRNMCQFSWYCDGKSDYPTDKDAWVNAQQRAYMMMVHGDFRGISQGATHYHAKYVSPSWARQFDLVGRIGVHIFYRWDN